MANEDSERRYKAPALEKGLDILELLAREGEVMTTSQIANKLGRSVSELFRMVLTLEARGYISQESGREGYGLTNKMFMLGLTQTSTRTMIELALPEMKVLAEEVGQSCHLTVASNEEIVVVCRMQSPREVGFATRVGYRRPIIGSTSGILLVAFSHPARRDIMLKKLAQQVSEQEFNEFLGRVEQAQEQGYVRKRSNFVEGITDLSAPVYGSEGVEAALTVPYVRCFPELVSEDDTLVRLLEAAQTISQIYQQEGR